MLRLQRGLIGFLGAFLLAWVLLAACRSGAESLPTLEPATTTIVITQSTATATPELLAAATTATTPPVTSPTVATESPSTAVAPTPAATVTPPTDATDHENEPSATNGGPARPTVAPPTPPVTPVPCPTRAPGEYATLMWEQSGPLPVEISLSNAYTAFLPPYDFFIGVENQIGYVRLEEPALLTSDPFSIFVYGFAEIAELPPITDIEAQADSLLYLTGGSRLTVVHAGDPCYLVRRATADFPFPAQDVEVEGERVYVGGSDGQQLHVVVLDRATLQPLATLTFPYGVWSAVGEQLLTHDLAAGMVTISDLSDLNAVVAREVIVPFDPQWQGIGQPQLFGDALSLLVWEQGILTVSDLLDPKPAALWRELDFYFALDSLVMQDTHTFVTENWCDMGQCSSNVFIAGRNPEGEFAFYSLYPHHPVFHYHAVGDEVVFAFSDYSLIVLDLTAPERQHVVRTYPLRGRLD